jgi:hypothetical protein
MCCFHRHFLNLNHVISLLSRSFETRISESSDDESTIFSHPLDDEFAWEVLSDDGDETEYMQTLGIDKAVAGNDEGPAAPTLPILFHPIYDFTDRKVFTNLPLINLPTLETDVIVDIYLKRDTNTYKHVIGDIGKSLRSIAKAYTLPKSTIARWVGKNGK